MGVIYAIQAGYGGPVKVGYCSTREGVRGRLKTLQTGNPHLLVVRSVMDGELSDERRYHREFRDVRMVGEWFQPIPKLCTLFACIAGDRDPIEWIYDRGYEAGYEAALDDAAPCDRCGEGFGRCECPETPEEAARAEKRDRYEERERSELLHGVMRGRKVLA